MLRRRQPKPRIDCLSAILGKLSELKREFSLVFDGQTRTATQWIAECIV